MLPAGGLLRRIAVRRAGVDIDAQQRAAAAPVVIPARGRRDLSRRKTAVAHAGG